MTANEPQLLAGGYGPPGGGPPGYGPPGGYGGPPGGGQPPGYGGPSGGYVPPGFDQAPQFGPPGFGPGGFAPPPQAPGGGPTEQLSIVSLVLGLVSLPGGCCCSLFIAPLAIGGIVTGIIGLNKINASGGTLQGKPLAIAGIACSGVSILIGVVGLVMRFGMLATQLWKP